MFEAAVIGGLVVIILMLAGIGQALYRIIRQLAAIVELDATRNDLLRQISRRP